MAVPVMRIRGVSPLT